MTIAGAGPSNKDFLPFFTHTTAMAGVVLNQDVHGVMTK
jgi:hypothetical protein